MDDKSRNAQDTVANQAASEAEETIAQKNHYSGGNALLDAQVEAGTEVEYAARVTQTSTHVIERFVALGVIESSGSMLRSRDVARIAQIQRLRQDLGLNLVGAAIVLDMAGEIAQLKAQLQAYRSQS